MEAAGIEGRKGGSENHKQDADLAANHLISFEPAVPSDPVMWTDVPPDSAPEGHTGGT